MASGSRDRPRSKRRSLDERVDVWGENQKAGRKNAPRKKARIQRAYRRAVTIELANGEDADTGAVRRTWFATWTGPTRRDHLAQQAERRRKLGEEPRRSAQARQRRALRRSGDSSAGP